MKTACTESLSGFINARPGGTLGNQRPRFDSGLRWWTRLRFHRFLPAILSFVIVSELAPKAFGQVPTLVKDIDAVASVQGSLPANLVQVGVTTFFTATDVTHGTELWKSDGTTAGTVLLKDIFPGSSGSSPANLVNVNGTLFFSASDGINGIELWKSDGTSAGTVMVKDLNTGSGNSSPANLVDVNGTLFFPAANGINGIELWKSDGTPGGTAMVKDIRSGSTSSSPSALVNVNGTLFFAATDGVNGIELWKTDGTSGGTVVVKDIRTGSSSSSPASLVNVNGTLFFAATDGVNGTELWTSDGTTAGTVMVKDIRGGSSGSGLGFFVSANGILFFTADDGVNGRELWKSDGTTAETVMVKDIFSGSGGSFPFSLVNVNGTLFFSADDGVNGAGLWSSDGTAGGTTLVKNIPSGEAVDVNGTLFFAAFDAANGAELWKSDGTTAGTVIVKDIFPGTSDSNPGKLINVNGTLLFVANDGVAGFELWKSDGTQPGTVMVKDIYGGTGGSGPAVLVNINGMLFFQAYDGLSGYELWKSDGTTAGTLMVKDIVIGSGAGAPINLVNVNGTLFFTSDDGVNGRELWKSDGTEAGTALVTDINSGSGSSNPSSLVNVNGTLFFAGTDGINGIELWKSDGTSAGTVTVKDLNTGSGNSSPADLVNVNGTLFFSASDGINGIELWKSDGTPGGTVLVKDIRNGSTGSSPSALVKVNGILFFAADDGVNGAELWKSDGTSAGTILVKDITPGSGSTFMQYLVSINNTLFFQATDGLNGQELWKSDGTAAGTVMVKDIRPGAPSGFPIALVNANGNLFFQANDGVNGPELWKSDGTAAGTVLVKDIFPGSSGSSPGLLTVVNGTVYFAADDGVNGRELWQSDGTAAGTLLLDVTGDSGGLDPAWLTDVNGRLFFTAQREDTGVELFTLVSLTEIGVEQPAGTDLTDGAAIVGFGSVNTDTNADRVFRITNSGSADLTGLGITIDGPDAAYFTVTSAPTAPVVPAGSTLFTVRFTPTTGGAKNAALHLANNDDDENPFDISLTGMGIAPNSPPIVANPIPDQTNTYGGTFNFTFVANTFTDPDASQTLAYTASNLPPGISFDGPSRTFSGTPTAVGTNAVTLTATDNGSPPLSTNTTFRIVVGKALLTVRALDQTNSYGSFFFLNPYVDAEYSGFKLDDNVLSLASLPDISTTATSSSPVGNYPLRLSGGSASHYDFALQDGIMTITPAPLMVIVHNACRLVNQTNPPLLGRLVELRNSDPITVSFGTAATPSSPAGSYPISVTFSDPNLRLPNYSVSYLPGELTVLPYDYQLDIVHAFGTTNEMGSEDIASTPIAAVMEGPDGVLYGVTQHGGLNGGGTVFRVNKDGTGYRFLVLLSTPMYAGVPFGGDPSLIRGTNGLLYGVASGNPPRPGNLFSVDTNGALTVPHTFSEGVPNGPLLLSTNGFLYGTWNGPDRIYRIAQDGTAFTNVWESPLSGAVPRQLFAGLIEGSDGWLYGTSVNDGNFGPGTVFRMRSDGSGMTVLHSFSSGGAPVARVLEGSDGWLYGTTVDGGIFFNGSVFKMAKDGTGYAILHHFDSLSGDGSAPMGALLEGNDGYLYGTTRAGGTSTRVFGGTVYRLQKDGSGYCILHNFGVTADDPSYLTSALIQASDGSFYSTANFGGMGNKGFVFRLTPLVPPTLAITRSGSNVTLSWSPPTPGFVLQQNNSLNVLTWTNSPSGATNPISVPATGDTRLYRLRLP